MRQPLTRPRRSARCVVTLLVVALSAGALAASPTIEKVVVESTTDEAVPIELIRSNMRSREGASFSPGTLSTDIKRLRGTGYFEDVRAEAVPAGEGRVTVRLRLTPMPRVRRVVFEGNERFKDRKLQRVVKQKEGELLNERQAAEDAQAIRKRYGDSGFYQTEVETIIQPIPNTGEANVVFRVQEEKRHKTRRVGFVGNTVLTDGQLRKQISSKHSWWSHVFRTGYLDDEKLEMDKDLLRSRYTSSGYLDFRVVDVKRVYDEKEKWVSLEFHLDEGNPYTVSSVSVLGNQRFSADELNESIELAVGSAYDSTVEAGDLARITAKYDALGYLDMLCYADRTRDGGAFEVGIEYRITEGVPCTIRDIFIQGNDETQDHVIRRELAIHPGDLGDRRKIRTSKARLSNLNYFETVDVTPWSTEREDQKDLLVRVSEKPTGMLTIGAGFSSEDAVLGTLQIAETNFDWRNWPRFKGGGQRLRLRMQAGSERDDFVLSFTEPWLTGRPLRFDWDLFRHDRDQDEYDEARTGTGLRLTRKWGRFKRQWVGYRLERTELDSFDDDLSNELKAEEGDYTSSAIVVGVSRDTRDRFVNPSRGSRLSLSGEVQPELLGSYSNIYRIGLHGAKYFPLFKRCVLKAEAQIGLVDAFSGDAILTYDDTPAGERGEKEVAIFDRYFAGGASSIRGFRRREVGPVDVREDPVGGKSLLRGTVEYVYPIFEKIRGTLFCDYGNVWRDEADWDPSELNISLGLGILLDPPIPIRLEYGWPVVTEQKHLDDADGRFHFSLAYFF